MADEPAFVRRRGPSLAVLEDKLQPAQRPHGDGAEGTMPS
jgi:hypothetical protein